MNTNQYSLTNLFIPAGGTVHAVDVDGPFSNEAEIIEWRQYRIDNFPFVPQGVYINNVDGALDIVIEIKPINWTIICKAGEILHCNFPSPQQSSVSIKGDPSNDTAKVVFVDFPVFPFSWRP